MVAEVGLFRGVGHGGSIGEKLEKSEGRKHEDMKHEEDVADSRRKVARVTKCRRPYSVELGELVVVGLSAEV